MSSVDPSPLFQSIQIGDKTARNRIFMSALTRNRAPGTIPTDIMGEYYKQRAHEGAGLIVTEGVLVTRQGTEWPHAPGIWNKEQTDAWKKIVDQVHAEGALFYAQLWHLGRVSHPEAPEQKLAGEPVYAPSAIAARGGKFRHFKLPGQEFPSYVTPTAVEDPWTLVKLFKDAAVNAKEAGFDGAEIHGANGYLVAQFLDSTSNQRTDQWGGSVENRARFGIEVVKAVKEVFGANVSIKVSPAGGYNDVGMPLEETKETFNYFLSEVDKLGVSYVTLVRYQAHGDPMFDGKPRATIHDTLETYKPIVKNAKVVVNASVTAEEGAQLVKDGKTDAISIGFNFITHPDLVKRVAFAKALDNIPDIPHLQWGKDGKDFTIGYTDYPAAEYKETDRSIVVQA